MDTLQFQAATALDARSATRSSAECAPVSRRLLNILNFKQFPIECANSTFPKTSSNLVIFPLRAPILRFPLSVRPGLLPAPDGHPRPDRGQSRPPELLRAPAHPLEARSAHQGRDRVWVYFPDADFPAPTLEPLNSESGPADSRPLQSCLTSCPGWSCRRARLRTPRAKRWISCREDNLQERLIQ